MTRRQGWWIAWAVHLAASSTGAWVVVLGAIDAGDSARGSPWLAALARFVAGTLLQPLGYWVLPHLPAPYWTWSGLGLAVGVLAVNSAVAVVVIRWLMAVLGSAGSRSRS